MTARRSRALALPMLLAGLSALPACGPAPAPSIPREKAPAPVAAVTPAQAPAPVPTPAVAPPAANERLRQQLQATVARSTRAIDSGRLAGEDLAAALCTRAEAQGDLGGAAEPEAPGALAAGLADATRAVALAPALARAWHCRGVLRWLNGDFAAAALDFSEALARGHDAAEALLRRGQARFYDGQLAAAAADFAQAGAQQADPTGRLYAALWQAAALLRQPQPQPLPPALQAAAAQAPDGDWPRPALALLAGLRSADELLAWVAQRPAGDERTLTLAEAWFHIGQHHLAQGRLAAARAAFEAVRAQGVLGNPEHAAAAFELQRLPR